MVNSAFDRLKKSVWSRRDNSANLKLQLYNAFIRSIAIYSSENWYLTQPKKLIVFENNCLSAILNIRLQELVSINEIRKQAKQQNPIENVIRKRHLTWFGHVCRMSDERLQKRIMEEDFDKKGNGEDHTRFLDLVNEETTLPVATAEK